MKKIICLTACLLASSVANAALLTFDGNGTLSDQFSASYQGVGDTYTQDGYTLSVGAGDHFDFMNNSGLYLHDGGANVHSNNFAYLTFAGGLFDLNSFDFSRPGELFTNLSPLSNYTAGTHNANLTDLTWAAFSPTSGSLYIDNINVTASVPEPASLAILGLGLVGLGFSRKQKNQVAA